MKVIYRIIDSVFKDEALAEIYEDCSVKVLSDSDILFKYPRLGLARLEEARSRIGGIRMLTNENMNKLYNEVFLMLCAITRDAPPFKRYHIEYLGEGKPWEKMPPIPRGVKL